MNQEWVNLKNRERNDKLNEIVKNLELEIKETNLLDDARKKEAMRLLNEKEYFKLHLYLNRNFISLKSFKSIKDGLEAQQKYDEWFKSLKTDILYEAHYCQNPYNVYLDSKEIEFDGDIIITDPCYIQKNKPEIGTYPERKDFFSYKEEKDYPDYKKKTDEEIEKLSETEKILVNLGLEDSLIYKSEQYEEEEKQYENAIKEYRKNNESDWEKCNGGFDMEVLGIHQYLIHDTIYGDWSCTTYDLDTNEELGRFCADAGLVSVFLLDEVLKYNPDFDYHLNRKWTTTWIKDFKGTVQIIVSEEIYIHDDDFTSEHRSWKKGDSYKEYEVHVIGKGINKRTGKPIHFFTEQTGL